MKKLGVKCLIVSNAAGCLNPSWRLGDIMLMAGRSFFLIGGLTHRLHASFLCLDHINLQGQNPLIGPNSRAVAEGEEDCPRFPSMANCYDVDLRNIVLRAASSLNMMLREGVYVALSGPSYETVGMLCCVLVGKFALFALTKLILAFTPALCRLPNIGSFALSEPTVSVCQLLPRLLLHATVE